MHSSAEAVRADAGRDFWHGVLAAGGSTSMPRWTRNPIPGIAVHDAMLPSELVAASRRLAEEMEVPLSTVLLAAHAKVLAALSGERDVVTGYVAGTRLLPCPLTTEAESWRELLLDTQRVQAQLLSHADFPLLELGRELDMTRPAFETVFDPTGVDGDLGEDIVLRLGIAQRGDVLALGLRYRTDVLGADCTARIAGYHLTALELITADLDAEHRQQSLLSAEELDFQREGLVGPRRQLPAMRAHQLFEQRVRAHPDRVAAVCGDPHGGQSLTYGQLINGLKKSS